MSAVDVGVAIITIFVLGLGFIAVHYMVGQSINKIVANPVVNSSNASVTAFNSSITISNRMDYITFWIFIGLTLSIIISSFFIPVEKIFVVFYFIILVLLVIASSIISYAWYKFTSSGALATSVTSFPLTNNILSYAPIYVSVIGFIALIITFVKSQSRSL